MRQPLYAPAISAAVRAQSALLDASNYRRMAFARTLRRDITNAYLDWLKARSSVDIVAASETLLRENLRVNESLFDNGKVTEDQVLRARAELLEVEQQKREVENLATQAQSYFNFLLNRDLLTHDRCVDAARHGLASADAALEQLWSQALERRPEVAQTRELTARKRAPGARRAQTEDGRRCRSASMPARKARTTASATATTSAPPRSSSPGGFSTAAAMRHACGRRRRRERQLVLRQEEIAQQIRLEVQQAFDRLQTARDSLATAQARAEAARAAFRIASRKRDEGVINQVEFIDARSTLTRAELNYNLTRFNVLARRADLEYATSTGDLPIRSRHMSLGRMNV